jgi:hypothetical protein
MTAFGRFNRFTIVFSLANLFSVISVCAQTTQPEKSKIKPEIISPLGVKH